VLLATRIFRDHWHTWCDLRLEDEVPRDQRAHVRKTVERLMLCRDPSAGYARYIYICPGRGFDRRVPFSCKTRFCPPSAPLRTGSCGKVRVDNWVNDACPERSRRIARDLYDVPHLHITLTSDDLSWPFFLAYRFLLKLLLKTAAQACPEHSRRVVRELVEELYPGLRIGIIYTLHPGGRDLGFKFSLLTAEADFGYNEGKPR